MFKAQNCSCRSVTKFGQKLTVKDRTVTKKLLTPPKSDYFHLRLLLQASGTGYGESRVSLGGRYIVPLLRMRRFRMQKSSLENVDRAALPA